MKNSILFFGACSVIATLAVTQNASAVTRTEVGRVTIMDGQTGATGESAYQAWKKLSGNANKTEAQFLESLKGATGAQGPQGPQGEKGDKGDTGATGAAGHSPVVAFGVSGGYMKVTVDGNTSNLVDMNTLKGATGSQGPKGETGETGPQGPAGSNGTNGTSCSIATSSITNGTRVTSTCGSTVKTFDVLNGAKGETGATGATGSQGPKGDTGATGAVFTPSVSSAGVISWTNNGGYTNPTSRNIRGPQGDQGPKGDTPVLTVSGGYIKADGVNLVDLETIRGPQGIQGIQGPQGEKGDNGTNGTNGVSCNIATSSITGGTRVTSTCGSTVKTFDVMNGAKGDTGDTPVLTVNGGYIKADGVNLIAVNDLKGANGADGCTPLIGTKDSEGCYTITPRVLSGGSCINSTPVQKICDGVDGRDGTNGTDGRDGTDGTSCTVNASKSGKVTTLTYQCGSDPQKSVYINDGTNGTNGTTYTPSVNSSGVLSWTANGGTPTTANFATIMSNQGFVNENNLGTCTSSGRCSSTFLNTLVQQLTNSGVFSCSSSSGSGSESGASEKGEQ